jgi:hypothetical protein
MTPAPGKRWRSRQECRHPSGPPPRQLRRSSCLAQVALTEKSNVRSRGPLHGSPWHIFDRRATRCHPYAGSFAICEDRKGLGRICDTEAGENPVEDLGGYRSGSTQPSPPRGVPTPSARAGRRAPSPTPDRPAGDRSTAGGLERRSRVRRSPHRQPQQGHRLSQLILRFILLVSSETTYRLS